MNYTDILSLTADLSDIYPGDTKIVKLDGTFTAHIETWHDDESSINDYEGDGEVSLAYSYHRDQNVPRPSHFTGRARKIQIDRGSWVWWEPYSELTETQIVETLPRIRNLLESGFYGITVTIKDDAVDKWGNLHRVTVALYSLGGIDTLDAPYFGEHCAEVISDALAFLPESIDKTLELV